MVVVILKRSKTANWVGLKLLAGEVRQLNFNDLTKLDYGKCINYDHFFHTENPIHYKTNNFIALLRLYNIHVR